MLEPTEVIFPVGHMLAMCWPYKPCASICCRFRRFSPHIYHTEKVRLRAKIERVRLPYVEASVPPARRPLRPACPERMRQEMYEKMIRKP